MKVVAIIQARIGSSRLPRKVLADFCGQSVLSRIISRTQMSQRIDQVVVATTVAKEDEEIINFCDKQGISSFSGSEEDVLGRFVGAAQEYDADWIVRINADNPFLAPEYLDELIEKRCNSEVDYASYLVGDRPAMLSTVGLFAELVSRDCLFEASERISDIKIREHVTLGIYQSPTDYRVNFVQAPEFSTDPRIRLTLDTQADLDLLKEIEQEIQETGLLQSSDTKYLGAEQLCKMITKRDDWLLRMEEVNASNKKT